MRPTLILVALSLLSACARGQPPAVPTPVTLVEPPVLEAKFVAISIPSARNVTLIVQNQSSTSLDVRVQDGAFRGTVLPDSTIVIRDLGVGDWPAFEAHDKIRHLMARRPAEPVQMGDTVRWLVRDRDIWHVIPAR